MVEGAANGLKRVREFPYRAFLLSGLLGLAVGMAWCLTGTGPSRWLADWQRANWGQPFPGVNTVLVLTITLLLFLVASYYLFTYAFGSVHYELPLPFTVRLIADQGITLVSFADIERPDAEDGKTIYRVPEEGFVALAEKGNPDCHGWRKLLIDLENIDSMGSGALATIITLDRRLAQGGGRLVLSSSRPELHQVFALTKLHKVLTLCRDKEEALRMLNPTPLTDDQVVQGG